MSYPQFPSIEFDESVTLTFDYSGTNVLNVGETLTGTPTLSALVINGTDTAPASFLSGVATISGGNQVLQAVSGRVSGVAYRLKAKCTTNQSRVLECIGEILVN